MMTIVLPLSHSLAPFFLMIFTPQYNKELNMCIKQCSENSNKEKQLQRTVLITMSTVKK